MYYRSIRPRRYSGRLGSGGETGPGCGGSRAGATLKVKVKESLVLCERDPRVKERAERDWRGTWATGCCNAGASGAMEGEELGGVRLESGANGN